MDVWRGRVDTTEVLTSDRRFKIESKFNQSEGVWFVSVCFNAYFNQSWEGRLLPSRRFFS